MKINKSNAFTLAEVLITMSIVGIIAAITTPTLTANIRAKQKRVKFKKALSTLEQAARLNYSNYFWNYSGTVANSCTASDNPRRKQTICALFNGSLSGATFMGSAYTAQENFGYPLSNGPMGTYGSQNGYILYQLADGSVVGTKGGCSKASLGTGSLPLNTCGGFIDVNGVEPPNKEVNCETAADTKVVGATDYKECTVQFDKYMGDVFPVVFYDNTVAPATNAAKYVLQNAN